tara:strand:- start:5951 stop:14443 length:8493 start_codon:yes stop_codon:yes gene_type:complete
MPLPEDYFSRKPVSITDDSLYPEFKEEDVDDKFSMYDMLGSAAWHALSSGTLGLTEFAAPTKSWEEKNTSERVGAAIGEAAGFFVPMGLLGRGMRAGVSAVKGSKAIANQAIKSATKNIKDDAFKQAAKKGLNKEIFSKEGKRLLYQHELGGETLEQVNRTLMNNTEAALRNGIKEAGLKADDALIGDIMNGLSKGLKNGEHLNSVSHWIEGYAGRRLGSGPVGKWMSRYIGEVAEDMAVLGVQGTLSNAIHAAAREDTEFAPGTAIGNGLAMSFAFPLVRAIPGGGERRMGELWNVLRADFKKTNYAKVAAGPNGGEDLLGLMKVIAGGKKGNMFSKTKWTAKSGNEYHLDDFLTGFKDIKDPKVLDDAVDIMGQIQNSVGKIDMVKMFRKEYLADTFNAMTITRMAVGAGVMNLGLFKSPASLKDMPGEELLTHLLLGGMMSRGRGGWLRDPESRTRGAFAENLNDHYELMGILGIKHDQVSDYLKVKDFQDYVVSAHIGLRGDPTVEEINNIFKQYEKIANDENPTGSKKSKGELNELSKEWMILRSALGTMESQNYRGFDPSHLTPKQRAAMNEALSKIKVGDKPLADIKYTEFMNEFIVNQADGIGNLYKKYFERLGRESSKGAEDRILNTFVDANGIINYGGFDFEVESNSVHELYRLLSHLKKRNMAQEVSSEDLPRIAEKDGSPTIKRLERINKELKGTLNRMGLGDGVEMYLNIGDPEGNPYLRTWLDSHSIKSQKNIGDLAIGKLNPDTQKKEIKFRDSALNVITDENGNINNPLNYKIVDSEGLEIGDFNMQQQVQGIIQLLYQGSKFAVADPIRKKNRIPIQESQAVDLIKAYKGLGYSITPESLLLNDNIDYIKSRLYETIGVKPQNIRVIDSLNENALIDIDRESGKITMMTDQGIRYLAERNGLDPEEYIRFYNEIKESLPSNVIQPPATGDIIEFPLEAGKETNIAALRTIHKLMPEIYSKEIIKSTKEAIRLVPQIDEDSAVAELNLMEDNIIKGDMKKALLNLENIEKLIPNAIDYESIKNMLIDADRNQLPLDLRIKELADGTGSTYDALMNMITENSLSSSNIQSLLVELIYKGQGFREGAIWEHNRLIDELSSKIGKRSEKATLDQLFEAYLQNNSFKSLEDLITGLNQELAGRKTPNDLDNSHMLNEYERMMQNYKSPNTKTKITIAGQYGLLDKDNQIDAKYMKMLKNRDFDSLKGIINPELKTKKLDDDLFFLSEIVRNTREQPIIRLKEIKNPDGTISIVREWVSGPDNTEFNTPANMLIDMFNQDLTMVIPIAKSGIIDGRFYSDISAYKGRNGETSKLRFESDIAQNRPEQKYVTEVLDGEQLNYDDLALSFLRIKMQPGDKIRYVEVSYGRPLAFIESTKTLKQLDKMYNNWYDETVSRYESDPDVNKQTIDNFKRAWDPEKVNSSEHRLRAMYNAKLNTAGFDKLWTPDAINDLEAGHFAMNGKNLKYQKLAEGGSLKNLGDSNSLRALASGLTELSPDKRASILRIADDLDNPNKQLRTGYYDDEVDGNPLLVRGRIINQIDNDIQNSTLKSHLNERYSNPERFKNTLDQSIIDGAIYISEDIKNLMHANLGESGIVNGFKGSIARGGAENVDYIMYDKGLFIFDPNIATAMNEKGLSFLKGASAAKGYAGNAVSGKKLVPRTANNLDLISDIGNLTNDNIMMHNLDGVNLRYGGHKSNNSPVPHPWSHYMPEDLVIGVRDGWQKLTDKINEVGNFSNALRKSANNELASYMIMHKAKTAGAHQMKIESFAEAMLNFGFTSRNAVVREAIVKTWEENALPIIVQPRNPKFAYPFIIPDLNSKNPIGLDIYDQAGDVKSTARIQLGEAVMGADADFMPVHSMKELSFVFRDNDIDYTFNYENGKFTNIYNPLMEYQDAGYRTNVLDKDGNRVSIDADKNIKVPKKVAEFVEYLDAIFKNKSRQKIHAVMGGEGGAPSIAGVQKFIQKSMNTQGWKGLKNNNFGLVINVERGPRKGPSDFMPVRVRKQDSGIGTAFKLNSYDSRANAQGDWDGDHVRHTHDYSTKETKEFLKHSFKMASFQEEYPVLESTPRKANIYGIGKDNDGRLLPAGTVSSNDISELKQKIHFDSMQVGKVIGMQSAIEWMYLNDFSIDGKRMKDNFDYDVNTLVNNKGMFNRLEKGNQSVVDFIANLSDKIAGDKGLDYMIYGDGETDLTGKMFNHPENSVHRDIVYEVINILKQPAAIFNQIYGDMGPKKATSWDIQQRYSDMRRFFSNPNQVVFTNLVRKYKRADVDINNKLNELVPLFFSVEADPKTGKKSDVTARDIDELKILALQGKIRPRNNVIKFGAKSITEAIRKNNIGVVMDEIVKKQMFKSTEIDNAWDNPNISNYKIGTDKLLNDIAMMRVLGITDSEMIANGETLLKLDEIGYLPRNAEKASLVHDLLISEENFLHNKLNYHMGMKSGNRAIIEHTTDLLNNISSAKTIIETLRGNEVLKNIKDNQKKYIKDFKPNKDGRTPKYYNQDYNKDHVIYKVVGKLYTDGVPNFDALQFVQTVSPGQRSKNLRGKHLILQQPIVGTRITRDSALDGYAWNFTYNSLPMNFVDRATYGKYESVAAQTRKTIMDGWKNALREYRQTGALAEDIFNNYHMRKELELSKFFKNNITDLNGQVLGPQYIIKELGESGSLIYYKAKMLLRPDIIAREYAEGDTPMPILRMNKKIFTEVFNYLHKNGHHDEATMIVSEYNEHKDFISGRSNETTRKLNKSSLFLKDYALPEGANQPLVDILSGIITPDMEASLIKAGVGQTVRTTVVPEGQVDQKRVRNMFRNWKENQIDRRRSCR